MKKSITMIAAILLLACTSSKATHIVGGEISVQWKTGNTFHVSVNFFRDCTGIYFDTPTVSVGLYDLVTNANVLCFDLPLTQTPYITLGDSCYTPSLCVQLGVYEGDIVIPNNPNGYYISYARCCRNSVIVNVTNSGNVGETWYTEIPDPALHNSTPTFGVYPRGYMCVNQINIQDFSCNDVDNDSLVYSLETPYDSHGSTIVLCPDPGTYPLIPWQAPYSQANMVGGSPALSINANTGIITANPNVQGVFLIGVMCTEYSRTTKQKLGVVRRDIQYTILPCSVTTAYPDTSVCAGNPVQLNAVPNGATSYKWAPATGLSNPNIQNPIATVSSTTTYTVTVTTSTCRTTATVTVNVNSNVSVQITPNGPVSFCQGGSVMLAASGANTYSWSTGATTPSINVTSSGTYTVTGNSSGCTGTASQVVTVNPNPQVTIIPNGPTTFCQGGSVILTANGATGYLWSPGGATSTSITANTTQTFTVTGTNSSGCSATATKAVAVNAPPQVAIAANGAIHFCQGDSVVLSASGALSYAWNTGASSSSIIVKNAQTFYTVGTDANGCTAVSNLITTVVNRLPVVSITPEGPTSFCNGGSVQLCAAGATTYIWSPNGSTAACLTASSTGTFSVTGTNANGCKASATMSVTEKPIPNVTIVANGPTTFCPGDSVTLTASGADSYVWSPGGQVTVSITVNQSATYSVTGTTDGCSAPSNAITVTINPNISVTIAPDGPLTFCEGGSVGLCATSGSSYIWSPTGETTQCITAFNPTTYSVQVTNSSGCFGTANISTVVNLPPTVIAAPDGPTTFCIGGSVNINGSGAVTYVWNPNNDSTNSINVTQSGSFYAIGTDANGCTGTSNTVSVIVNPLPVVTIAPDGPTTICAGYSVNLNASGAATYLWSPGSSTDVSINVSSSGSYSTVGTDVNGCSASSNSIAVIVNPNPTVTIIPQGPTEICEGGSVQLCASNGTTFSWNLNGGSSQCFIAMDPGNYIVTITDANGCSAASEALPVTVSLAPSVFAGVSGVIDCNNTSVMLLANNCVVTSGVSYSWSGPGGYNSTLQCPSASVTGSYIVTASNTVGCTNTAFTSVSSNISTPDVTAAGGQISCGQPSVQLTANSSVPGATYSWTGPNGFTSTNQNPTVTDSGTYTVTIVDPSNGCTNSTSVIVITLPGQMSGTCGDQGSVISGFELDGNATTQTINPPPDDWDLVYNGTSHADYTAFMTDAPSNADNYFYQGTKDIQDISSWNWTVNSVPDKDDLLHAGAAMYGHLFYFFGDRFATNGNSQMGLWLLQDIVQPLNNGTFSGKHEIGDLLILTDFTGGGSTYNIFAYEWVASGGSDGPLNKLTLEQANAYGIVNSVSTASPWPYTPKFGPSGMFPSGAFFEGGVDLACLQGDSVKACFPSFIVETRTSQEATAELKDFIFGSLSVNPNGGHRDEAHAPETGNMALHAYPNPFTSVSTIEFENSEATHTLVEVYTLTGQKIATLFDKNTDAGVVYRADFDGSKLSAGVYIYRVSSGGQVTNGKLILMK